MIKMKEKKRTILEQGAPAEVVIENAENKAEDGTPQKGDTESFDAESNKKAAEFEKLIRGEYKKEFGDRVRKIIERRLKEVKKVKEESSKNSELTALIMQKYGITDNDTEKLERMIKEDMNTDNKETKNDRDNFIQRLIAQNEALRRENEEAMQREAVRERANKLKEEAQKVKSIYPQFDFNTEIKNEGFVKLLRAGIGMKEAYEVCNIETILKQSEKTAQKKVVDAIRQKGARPVENGTEPGGGIVFEKKISRLTKKQRAELAKRAEKGEKIEL